MATIADPTIRHHLEPGDPAAIVALHRREYCPVLGLDERFVTEVEQDVNATVARGWPEAGGVWLVELDDRVAGSLALTFEGEAADGVYTGQIRWLALELELRGAGLGPRLLAEALETAEDQGMERLELWTFSELEAVAGLCRRSGFELAGERERHGWRRDGAVVLQHLYVVTL